MIIILAGSVQQAHEWADENDLNPAQYRIIYDYVQMLGMRPDNNEIELVGTWRENELMRETVERLSRTEWRHMLRKKLNGQ